MSSSQHSVSREDALDRLLAHRVRGFGHPEGSLQALEAALETDVAYIEIDTRVTRDCQILVYHDATLATYTTTDKPVFEYDLGKSGPPHFKKGPPAYEVEDAERPDVEVPTLEEFLRVFAAKGGDTMLQVDLKDPLEEIQHCDLIRAAGVADRTWIISWYPEVLMRAHAYDPGLRLGLSHLPLPRLAGPLTGFGRLLVDAGFVEWLGRRYGERHPNLEGLELYFNDEQPDDERATEPGRFPMHVLTRLPRGELLDALRDSRGGVGLHSSLLRRSYVRAARAAGLRTFVYTIEDSDRYLAAVRDKGPDIIFSDKAADLLAQLGGAPDRG